ncbi:MAG: hypothetical protein V8Q84_07800 [Bilophila sp.]
MSRRTSARPEPLSIIPARWRNWRRTTASFAQDRLGTPETEEKRRERVRAEIASCAETLRRELGHPVRSLCWPWGSGSDVAVEEARQEGFAVFFTTRMGANPPAAPAAVRRFKVRDAGWTWLRLRLEIYSRPRLAALLRRLPPLRRLVKASVPPPCFPGALPGKTLRQRRARRNIG